VRVTGCGLRVASYGLRGEGCEVRGRTEMPGILRLMSRLKLGWQPSGRISVSTVQYKQYVSDLTGANSALTKHGVSLHGAEWEVELVP